MIYIGKLNTFKIKDQSLRLKVPFYHRAATGILSGTELYAVPKINKTGQVKEIVFSPIHPKSWPYIWTFEINSSDRKGLIRDITEIFSNYNINILMHDFLTTKAEGQFHFKIIADISEFCTLESYEHTDAIKEEIEAKIAIPLRKINADPANIFTQKILDRKVTVDFKPNQYLSSNCLKEHDDDNMLPWKRKRQFLSDKCPTITVSKHCMVIKQGTIDDLELSDQTEIDGVIISDTEEKFMRLRFFNDGQKIVNLEIVHDNEPGAIFSFSDYILHTGHNNFNIIACYNRLEAQKSTCHWYAIVDVTSYPDAIFDFMNKVKWQGHSRLKELSIPVQKVAVEYSKSLLIEFRKELKNEIFDQFKRKAIFRIKKYWGSIIWMSVIIVLLAYIGVLKNIYSSKNIATLLFAIYGVLAAIIFDIYHFKASIEVVMFLSKSFIKKKK